MTKNCNCLSSSGGWIERNDAIQSLCLCTPSAYGNKIRYNLQSGKYTVCIVQDKVGELVASGPVLWEFWVRGNCLGMMLLILRTWTDAHLLASPFTSPATYRTGQRQQLRCFPSFGQYFTSRPPAGIPGELSPLQTTANDWLRGFWSVELTQETPPELDRGSGGAWKKAIYKLSRFLGRHGPKALMKGSGLQLQSFKAKAPPPPGQGHLMSRDASRIPLEVHPVTNSTLTAWSAVTEASVQESQTLFPVCHKQQIDSVWINQVYRSTEPTCGKCRSYLWSGWETCGCGRQRKS